MTTTTSTLIKRLLTEIDTQVQTTNLTSKYANTINKSQIYSDFFSKYQFTEMQARNMYSYMESTRKHRELMHEYFPSSNKTEYHKVMDAAMRVGLQLPKTFSDALGEDSIVDKPSVGFTSDDASGSGSGREDEKKEATC